MEGNAFHLCCDRGNFHRDNDHDENPQKGKVGVPFANALNENGIGLWGTARLPGELQALPGLEYAVSFCVPLSAPVVESVRDLGAPTKLYFHHYRTTNAFLDSVAFRVMQAFMRGGHRAAYVPASQSESGMRGLVPHKAVARLAGLGGIGQNALLLTEQYGPAVRLSTVLTDMPLPTGTAQVNPCTNCGACVRACPSGALTGRMWEPGMAREDIVDAKKCSVHMKRAYQDVGRGAVCGVCVAVCPIGHTTLCDI